MTHLHFPFQPDSRGRSGRENEPYAPALRLPPLLQAALAATCLRAKQ